VRRFYCRSTDVESMIEKIYGEEMVELTAVGQPFGSALPLPLRLVVRICRVEPLIDKFPDHFGPRRGPPRLSLPVFVDPGEPRLLCDEVDLSTVDEQL
jgi:hypothetical protein